MPIFGLYSSVRTSNMGSEIDIDACAAQFSSLLFALLARQLRVISFADGLTRGENGNAVTKHNDAPALVITGHEQSSS